MKKRTIISAILILLSAASFSQVQDSTHKPSEYKTLFGHDNHSGAYGAFTVGYSEIDQKQAVIFGGRFVWLTGHSLGLGFGGTGFSGFATLFSIGPFFSSAGFAAAAPFAGAAAGAAASPAAGGTGAVAGVLLAGAGTL